MLASIYLISSRDFEKVKKEGKLVQQKNFGVIIRKRNDDNPPKFGFVISTKISKLAVHRNRIKRAMNEAARRNVDSVPPGHDLLFLVKTTMEKMTTEEIMNDVVKYLRNFKKDEKNNA